MTTERITVTAADLQPGDQVVNLSYDDELGDVEVRYVDTFVSVNDRYRFEPGAPITVDRPVPTSTLTFDVPESKREAVEQAVQRVLDPSPVKVGDRVRRTLRHGPGDGGTGWPYEPGAVGTVDSVHPNGSIHLTVDGDFRRRWRAGSFAVVPS